MHAPTLITTSTLLLSASIVLVDASIPDFKYQRRSYRHNEALRLKICGISTSSDGIGGHALKPRFTPPPAAPVAPGQGQGAIKQVPPVDYVNDNDNDGTVTPPGASDAILPQPIEPPNASPGINTPDNVAPDTWTEDAGCAAYYAVQSGDICNTILETFGTAFGTTLDTFYTINPSVDSECSNLKPGWAYCIGLMKPANALPDTFTPQQGCTRYQTVQAGDYCLALVGEHQYTTGLTLDDLYTSNPSIDSQCLNLWIGTSYCVGLEGGVVVEQPEEGDSEEEEEGDQEDCPRRLKRTVV